MRWLIAIVVLVGCGRRAHDDAPLRALASTCAKGDLGCSVPILFVRDLAAGQRYYKDKLGFELDWTDGDPPDFGSVTRGEMHVFMCQRCQGNPGSWIWVATKNVDELYRELQRRGALIQEAPEDKRWGMREMQVKDLDGNVLRIGSPLHD